ncbi:MAG: YihY/virulence factor BrkB family protein [Ktedonobacteraceae bacterium]
MATGTKQRGVTGALQSVEKETRPFQQFITKFNNDWSTTLSAALAYNLLMAIFPIALAILAILGFVLGSLSPTQYTHLKTQLLTVLPVSSQGIVDGATNQLAKSSTILALVAVVLALFNGSRLFILIEGIFGIIYHVRHRTFIKQNLMAIGMLILFIILIPIMAFASALPAVVLSILPGSSVLAFLGGILGVLIASYILFQAIYMVVPNQHISFRNSWLGALVAAIALDIYLTLFPLYVQHFLASGPAASLGSAIFLLIFFYYFAIILLIGAEVNAFFAEGVKATPVDLVTLVHITTSHLPKTKEDKDQQAAASHKEAPIGSAAAETHVDETVANSDLEAYASITNATAPAPHRQEQQASAGSAHGKDEKKDERETKKDHAKPTTSRVGTAIEALAGTALAFVVELVRMRRGKLE